MSNKLSSRGKKKQNTISDKEIVQLLLSYLICLVLLVICVGVSLYLKDGYYGVGDCKFDVYKYTVFIGFPLILFLLLFYGICCGKEKKKEQNNGRFTEFCSTDYAVISFFIMIFVSALAGGNLTECVMGYNGWYMGIFALVSFVCIYVFTSRFGSLHKAVLTCLCICAFIAFVLGVLNRMLIDPLGVYEGIADVYKNQFLSTLGQASWYSSFIAVTLPIGAGVFWYAKATYLRVLTAIYVLFGFATMFSQNSDSAYLAFAGMMAVFFWFSVTSIDKLERFLELLLLSLLGTRFMYLLLLMHPNPILELDTISHFIIFHKMMWLITGLVMILWAVSMYCKKKQIYHVKGMKIFRNVLFILASLMVLFMVFILLCSAKGTLTGWMLTLSQKIPYLQWSDNWGNGRGRTWAFTVQMFKDMDIVHKLFGVGPDGYATYAYRLYEERLVSMWGTRTLTNAHNEWMNALINYGIVGVMAYIAVFITAIKEMVHKKEQSPIVIGFIASIVAYMAHNIFCYQTVCCTPFIFMVIGFGIYICRGEH